MSERIPEILKVIDDCLLEEEIVLEGLQRAVAQNGMTQREADANFQAYMGTRDLEEHSELYYLWLASHDSPPEES